MYTFSYNNEYEKKARQSLYANYYNVGGNSDRNSGYHNDVRSDKNDVRNYGYQNAIRSDKYHRDARTAEYRNDGRSHEGYSDVRANEKKKDVKLRREFEISRASSEHRRDKENYRHVGSYSAFSRPNQQVSKTPTQRQVNKWDKQRTEDRNTTPFRGSALITTLISQNPVRFRNRILALEFAQNLFREGTIKGVFRSSAFEDSDQLYVWQDEKVSKNLPRNMTSSASTNRGIDHVDHLPTDQSQARFQQFETPEKQSLVNAFFKELEEDFPDSARSLEKSGHYATLTPWTIQRASTASSDSSADTITHSYPKYKDKTSVSKTNYSINMATSSREHEAIPEESSIERLEGNSLEFELGSNLQRTSENVRRWHDSQHCYSDNEKQLIEEMKRLKRDHQEIVKGYEDRVNKLMTKMHELRGIAEMLENSSTKSSPYGVLPKNSILSLIGAKFDHDQTQDSAAAFGFGTEGVVPPPLPPRPGRGNKVYPNKPIVRPSLKMKPLDWARIILKETGSQCNVTTIWHTMLEPKIDTDEVERLFKSLEARGSEPVTLYDDVISKRGRTRPQLVTVIEREKAGRVAYTMKALPCSLSDLVNAVSTLEVTTINSDRFAELMELFGAKEDVDKINNYVKRKSPGHLDHPEYLLLELSKMEYFRSRVDFLRFRYRMQWQLFEIDQQLRELHTACDEITNSLALKNLLETILAVGNYLNGATPSGQADGYGLDILNKLKDTQDKDNKGNLLEFVMKMYCQFYEVEIDIGCPTRFKLPEPSNMRHAAQVSFDSIQESLGNLLGELRNSRDKLMEEVGNIEGNQSVTSFRTTAENFFTSALEVISDEEKLLRETQDTFSKTKAYFMLDDPECPPQEFFQIWAVFLHDCKYYWKLAHRKIAKERFEFEFKYKGQISVNSAHGYDSFRASMLRRLAAIRSLPDNISSPAPSRQVGQWVDVTDSAGQGEERPQVPPLPHKDATFKATNFSPQHCDTTLAPHVEHNKSPSPKPLTSEPPSSLHKPQALTANGNTAHKNYENHADMSTALSSEAHADGKVPDSDRPPMPLPFEAPTVKSPDKHFSFKTWFTREPGARKNSGDSKGASESKTVGNEPDTLQKRPGSGTTFSKLRNTVVQKFTGTGSNAKRPNQLNVGQGSEAKPLDVTPSFTPLKIITDNETIDPYVTSLGRSNASQNENAAYPLHFHTSSAERRNLERENRWAVSRKVAKTRNGSDISTEYAGLYHTPPFTTSIDKDGYASPQVIGPFAPKNDINNNEKGISGTGSVDRNVNRTRAPIALGSNISISDVYKKDDINNGNDHSQGVRWTPNMQSNAQMQAPNTVPTYKSKLVHNYENQGRLEAPQVARQVAQPVAPYVPEPATPTDTSLTALKVANCESVPIPERTVSKSHHLNNTSEVKSKFDDQQKGTVVDTPLSSKQPQKPLNLGRAYQRQQNQLPSGQIMPKTDRAFLKNVPPQKPPRTPQMQRAAAYRDLSKTHGLSASKDSIDNIETDLTPRGKTKLKDDPGRLQVGSVENGLSNSKEDLIGQSRNRETKRDQNISSLINRFEVKRQPKEVTGDKYKEPTRDRYNQSKQIAMTSTPVTEKRPLTLVDDDDLNPPPLPPRLDQDCGTLNSSHSSQNRNTHNTYPDPSQNMLPRKSRPIQGLNHTPSYPPKPSQADVPHKLNSLHIRQDTETSENDEGYKDQLRKAANSSVFERYTKQAAPQVRNYAEIPSNTSQQYTPSRTQDTMQRLRQQDQVKSNTPFNQSNTPYTPSNRQQKTPLTSLSNHQIDRHNNYTKDNFRTRNYDSQNHVSNTSSRIRDYSQENGPTTVVQPNIVQQGNVAFMEI